MDHSDSSSEGFIVVDDISAIPDMSDPMLSLQSIVCSEDEEGFIPVFDDSIFSILSYTSFQPPSPPPPSPASSTFSEIPDVPSPFPLSFKLSSWSILKSNQYPLMGITACSILLLLLSVSFSNLFSIIQKQPSTKALIIVPISTTPSVMPVLVTHMMNEQHFRTNRSNDEEHDANHGRKWYQTHEPFATVYRAFKNIYEWPGWSQFYSKLTKYFSILKATLEKLISIVLRESNRVILMTSDGLQKWIDKLHYEPVDQYFEPVQEDNDFSNCRCPSIVEQVLGVVKAIWETVKHVARVLVSEARVFAHRVRQSFVRPVTKPLQHHFNRFVKNW